MQAAVSIPVKLLCGMKIVICGVLGCLRGEVPVNIKGLFLPDAEGSLQVTG